MSEWSEEKTTVGTMKSAVSHFLKERAWEKNHSPKNLAMSVAIESAELMEIFQWVPSEKSYAVGADPEKREHIKDEVADVVIYCLSLARTLEFDLAAAIQKKIEKNGLKYPLPK